MLVVAAARMTWELAERFVLFDAQVQFSVDAPLYFGVGRGILNGLVPYRDLFETKPPGMFVLAMLSLVVSGDERFAMVLQILALAGIPWLLVLFAANKTKHSGRLIRSYLLLLSFLFGSGLAFFTADHAGRFQTESFGAFAGIAYLVIMFWGSQHRPTKTQTLFGSLFLMGAVGLKEPFVLTLLAAAALLSRTRSEFFRTCIVPLAAAVCLGTLIIALLGWLHPYLMIYLREIFGGRLSESITYRLGADGGKLLTQQPAWLRGFIVIRVFERFLWYHNSIPFLGLGAVVLWLANPALKRPGGGLAVMLLTMAAVWLGGVLLHQAFFLLQLLEIVNFQVPIDDPFFRTLLWRYAGWATVFLAVLGIIWRVMPPLPVHVATAVGMIYVTTFAIGLGGEFWIQHYVFAIPVAAAVMLRFVWAAAARPESILVRLVTFLLGAMMVLMAIFAPKTDYAAKRKAEWTPQRVDERVAAAHVDAVMDDCGYERYLPIGVAAYAYTKHSPYLLGWEFVRAFGQSPSPHFREKFVQSLHSAPLIVASRTRMREIDDARVHSYIDHHFTDSMPDCAGGYAPSVGEVFVLYREDTDSP